ncbi:MAG: phytoene/squalene synthase family protein [Gemmataceae bacterium]
MDATLVRSYAYCEKLARRQAGNFYPAFRLLPSTQRRGMCALYAFMRVTDDLADDAGSVADKAAALNDWRLALRLTLEEATYRHPLLPAVHHTVERFAIPAEYLHDVLDGVMMDLDTRVYQTFDELYRYCYRVASAVGLACIHIWGFHAEQAKVHAEALGIAFQLTNILRDLAEDAERGRIYLPHEELQRFDYGAEELERGAINDRFRALMRFQIERARRYYQSADLLLPLLRPAGRAVAQVMTCTYRGLLDVIEQRDYDVFSTRVRLSGWRKLGLVVQALPVRWGWA